jgi:hypothetical protein
MTVGVGECVGCAVRLIEEGRKMKTNYRIQVRAIGTETWTFEPGADYTTKSEADTACTRLQRREPYNEDGVKLEYRVFEV